MVEAASARDVHGRRSRLLEASILPTALADRSIGGLGYVWLWIGMAVIIATFQLGAGGIAGLPLVTVLLTIFFANLALGIVMALTADIGTEHGLSFAVYLRAPFGTVGTHLPSVSRGIVAAIWFGIQTYLGALALNGIFEYLIGFDSWAFWYAAFAVVQVVNTAMGIRAVEKLAAVAAPAIILISIWMYFTLDDLATASGNDIWTFAGDADLSVVVLFVANMAFWSALAVDIPNITRYLRTEPGARGYFRRNRNVFVAQFVALPVTQTWIALIGAASFVAADDWNPINVIQDQGTGFTLVVLLVMVVLAQWSTNNAANLIPAALTFVNVVRRGSRTRSAWSSRASSARSPCRGGSSTTCSPTSGSTGRCCRRSAASWCATTSSSGGGVSTCRTSTARAGSSTTSRASTPPV